MKCVHVYEVVGADLCPHCGSNTHEQNWVQELKYRRAYVERVGLFFKKVSWWSI